MDETKPKHLKNKKLLDLDQADPEIAIKIVVSLANEFDGMKGLMMKFGLIASYLSKHLLPHLWDKYTKHQLKAKLLLLKNNTLI